MREDYQKNGPLVSVLIPTFNRARYFQKALKSILNQSYENMQVIVINDGGQDVSDIVESFYDSRILFINRKENYGKAYSLNEALKHAEGKYVAYLDDDDIYYPEHLETLVSRIKGPGGYDCVYADSWRCYGDIKDNRFIERSRKKYEKRPPVFDRAALRQDNYISTLNVMHKKSCLLLTVMGLT